MKITILPASEWASGKPGIYAGVSNADYHAAPGLSSTALKKLHKSPAHAALKDDGERSQASKDAMNLGTLTHALILEGVTDLAASGFIVRPEGINGRTTEGKAKLAEIEASGLEIIPTSHPETALRIRDAVAADRDCAHIVAGNAGWAELSIRAVCPILGITMKARLDHCDASRVSDLKTTLDAEPVAFGKECDSRAYWIQACYYLEVARMAGLEFPNGFWFVAAAKVEPYEVSANYFGPDHEAWPAVHSRTIELISLWAKCQETGRFPKRRWAAGHAVMPNWSEFRSKV